MCISAASQGVACSCLKHPHCVVLLSIQVLALFTPPNMSSELTLSVMAARVKTWDDAARLLLGSIGTSGAVRWYSGDLKQHKSARIRRSPASPHDLEIVVCQQRSRRESGRGSSKSVLGQASAGWNWLKKQAGKGVQVRNGKKEHMQEGKMDDSQALG